MSKRHRFWMVVFVMMSAVALSPNAVSAGDICWKDSYGRGAGTIPKGCPPGQVNDAGLCYPRCPAGYKNSGPLCLTICPRGFRDTGLHCLKPKSYGRGAGFPWKFGDAPNDRAMFKRCERRHGAGRCEKHGAVVYPKCRAGFKPAGCCVCSPICPRNMTDIGVSCQMGNRPRGAGKIPTRCPAGKENDAGLCYRPCNTATKGVGPVCWAKRCPKEYPVDCGAACAVSKAQCVKSIVEQVSSTGEVALNVALIATTGGAGNAAMRAGITAGKHAAKGAKGARKAVKFSKAARKAMKAKYRQKLKGSRAYGRIKNARRINKALDMATDALVNSKEQGTFDFTMLDPTGVSSVVVAFAKPICHMPAPTATPRTTPARRAPKHNRAVMLLTPDRRNLLYGPRRGRLGLAPFRTSGRKIAARWSLVPIPGTKFVRLSSVERAGAVLHIERGPLRWEPIKMGAWSAQWELIPSGPYRLIRNRWKPKLYLQHTARGVIVAPFSRARSASAMWRVQ